MICVVSRMMTRKPIAPIQKVTLRLMTACPASLADAEQHRKGNGRRPGRAEQGEHDRLGNAEDDGCNQRSAHAAEPRHDDDAEGSPDIGAVERRIDRRDDDQERARNAKHGGGDTEGPLLDANRVGAHQAHRLLVLRHCADRASHEGFRQIKRKQDSQGRGDRKCDHKPERNTHVAEAPGLADIGGGDRALVDAELQDDQYLDDEGDAEEEGDAAHGGVTAAPFECLVIEAIGGKAEQEQQRRDQKPCDQRIDVKAIVEEEHGIGRHHQEGRVGNV